MKARGKKTSRKPRNSLGLKKKVCRFCADRNRKIDYKDVKLLETFIKERGKIISSRVNGNCAKHQRRIAEEIKKARFLALLPYVKI